ncbi:MAG TPA: hypothetical protein VFT22_32520 [Kofleriaceae bacterium]|nr:hypothetical protein [Kofleriaceae bacterium]
MGRTALYRDPAPFRPSRSEVQLDSDVLLLTMPDGKQRRHALDGSSATLADGFFIARGVARGAPGLHARPERRFVRMLILERDHERHAVITPPDRGAVAPNVVRLPEAPDDAAIVDDPAWDALSDWIMGGGRLGSCAIVDLARLAVIATPRFALLIGQVAAQRALELVWSPHDPLRGALDLEAALHPLATAARQSPRAAEALHAARIYASGATLRRRRA